MLRLASSTMGLFGRQHYEIRMEPRGRLSYREGNHEYVFPVYEQDGQIIIAGFPSSFRLYLFFGWYRVPRRFSTRAGDRIFPRLLDHFRSAGRQAWIFERGDAEGQSYAFYPELFEQRGKAAEILDQAGFTWFSDYGSIDVLHEEYGLEVGGIRTESSIEQIANALQEAFPHWHYCGICHSDYGREPGWEFSIHMFPKRGDGRFVDSGWE